MNDDRPDRMDQPDDNIKKRGNQQQTVEPVKNTAVSRHDVAKVLDMAGTFDVGGLSLIHI